MDSVNRVLPFFCVCVCVCVSVPASPHTCARTLSDSKTMCVFFPGIPAVLESAAGGFRGKSISSLREPSLFSCKVWCDLFGIMWRSPAIWIRVGVKTRSVMHLHCTFKELYYAKCPSSVLSKDNMRPTLCDVTKVSNFSAITLPGWWHHP